MDKVEDRGGQIAQIAGGGTCQRDHASDGTQRIVGLDEEGNANIEKLTSKVMELENRVKYAVQDCE